MPSHNFKDKAWIEIKDGIVTNPYDLLPPLFEGETEEQLEEYITDPMLSTHKDYRCCHCNRIKRVNKQLFNLLHFL